MTGTAVSAAGGAVGKSLRFFKLGVLLIIIVKRRLYRLLC